MRQKNRLLPWHSVITRSLHLYTLSAFFISGLILDVLRQYQQFFVSHKANVIDIVIVAIVIGVVLPATVSLLTVIFALVNKRVWSTVHSLVLIGLASLPWLYLFQEASFFNGDYSLILVFSLTGGLIASLSYWRFPIIQTWLTLMTPFTLVFPIVFIIQSEIVFPNADTTPSETPSIATTQSGPPVFFIIFDELSTQVLMDGAKNIDKQHFPNFAKLADSAYWFRNSTTTSTSTTLALPTILTGRYSGDLPSRNRKSPTYKLYPENACTQFFEAGYTPVVYENTSNLCSNSINELIKASFFTRITNILSDIAIITEFMFYHDDLINDELSISNSWAKFAHKPSSSSPSDILEDLISRIKPNEQRFYLWNSYLPHMPHHYFPSGNRYTYSKKGIPARYKSSTLLSARKDQQHLIKEAYRRYLLQAQYTDHLLGKFMDRLKELEIYDDSLIIVTADHGVTYRPGVHRRQILYNNEKEELELINEQAILDLVKVPLIIKFPHEQDAQVLDQPVQSSDIMPTIMNYLNISKPDYFTGRDLLDESLPEPDSYNTTINADNYKGRLTITHNLDILSPDYNIGSYKKEFDPDRSFAVRTPWDNHIGKPGIDLQPISGAKVYVNNQEELAAVDLSSGYIPALLSGNISFISSTKEELAAVDLSTGDIPALLSENTSFLLSIKEELAAVDLSTGDIPALLSENTSFPLSTEAESKHAALAIVINGSVEAVTRTYIDKKGTLSFYVIAPEQAFRDGENIVEVVPIAWID